MACGFKCLKPNGAADHSAKAGPAGPAAVNLALDEHVTIGGTKRNTSVAAVALVVGVN
jgi:hypothetical protein